MRMLRDAAIGLTAEKDQLGNVGGHLLKHSGLSRVAAVKYLQRNIDAQTLHIQAALTLPLHDRTGPSGESDKLLPGWLSAKCTDRDGVLVEAMRFGWPDLKKLAFDLKNADWWVLESGLNCKVND